MSKITEIVDEIVIKLNNNIDTKELFDWITKKANELNDKDIDFNFLLSLALLKKEKQNDITLKVLGTVSPNCKDDHNCPGFLINDGSNQILLDCGNGITRLLNMPNDLNKLTVFISHLHKDHYADLFSIGYDSYVYHNQGLLNDKVKVYIPSIEEPKEWLGNCPKEWFDYLVITRMREQYFDIKKYNESNKVIVDRTKVSFMRNRHDGMESFSTKLENGGVTIVYTGDVGYNSAKDLIDFSKNADLLISESSLIKEDNVFSENHLHAYQAAEIAKYAKVKQLLLTHFWPTQDPNLYLKEAKEVFDNVEIAREGKILTLKKGEQYGN